MNAKTKKGAKIAENIGDAATETKRAARKQLRALVRPYEIKAWRRGMATMAAIDLTVRALPSLARRLKRRRYEAALLAEAHRAEARERAHAEGRSMGASGRRLPPTYPDDDGSPITAEHEVGAGAT